MTSTPLWRSFDYHLFNNTLRLEKEQYFTSTLTKTESKRKYPSNWNNCSTFIVDTTYSVLSTPSTMSNLVSIFMNWTHHMYSKIAGNKLHFVYCRRSINKISHGLLTHSNPEIARACSHKAEVFSTFWKSSILMLCHRVSHLKWLK